MAKSRQIPVQIPTSPKQENTSCIQDPTQLSTTSTTPLRWGKWYSVSYNLDTTALDTTKSYKLDL